MKKSSLLALSFVLCTIVLRAQSVGTTDGVFDVSNLGAANYSIPIKVPEGINGMQPSLAMVYNSQGGNGPLGTGWSISGLSFITRTGNSIYHDGKVNGISLTSNDRFALDGNRLIAISGAYGTANSFYHTEVESFKEIKANGALGSGPQWFTVTDQNGWTYEYGNTADSRQVPVGKIEAASWYLSKIKDLKGNYITFEYNNADGDVLPKTVKYNCNENTGLTFQSYVSFSYTTGTNPNTGYIAGGSIKTSKRINKISVIQKVGSTWHYYKSYIPEYTEDFYTHLTKITEKGTDETEVLNPTEFTYGPVNGNVYADVSTLQTNDPNKDIAMGDFNGDGRTDVIQYSNINTSPIFKLLINASNASSTGFTETQNGSLQMDPTVSTNFNTLLDQTDILPFDYDGDGKDDFVYMQMQNYKKCKCSSTKQAFFVYTSSGTSITPLDRKIVSSTYPGSSDGFGNMVPVTGDFDGDGKSELLLVGSWPLTNLTYPSFLLGKEYLTATTSGGNSSTPANTPVYLAKNLGVLPFSGINDPAGSDANDIYSKPVLLTIDYNGDGKNEILAIRKDANNVSHARIYSLNVTFDANGHPVLGSPAFVQVNESGYPSVWHNVFTGDFNGDGITDVLTYFSDNNQSIAGWEVGYGNGNGLFISSGMNQAAGLTLNPNIGPYYNSNGEVRPVLVADFNGDGKDDIYNYFVYIPNQAAYPPKIYYAKGSNTFTEETATTFLSGIGDYQKISWIGDYNGDGQADLLTRQNAYYNTPYIYYFHKNETRHLLSKIKNGLGSETKINYLPLSSSSVYSNQTANSYTYPYIKRTIPFKVVSRMVNDNGTNVTGDTTNYAYKGLRFHAQGKGLLGFENVSKYNVATRTKTEKQFGLNTTYVFPFLETSYSKYLWPVGGTEEVLSYQTNVYGVYPYSNKRIFPYQISIQQANALTGETTTTTNNYVFPSGGAIPFGTTYSSTIGKPFSITINKGNGLEVSTQTFTYPAYAYLAPGTFNTVSVPVWVHSRPSKIVSASTRQGDATYSRTATFTYDNANGQLNQTVSDPNTTNEVYNMFYYDAYGNPETKYLFGNNVLLKQEEMEYDPSHRYVTKSYFVSNPAVQHNVSYDPLTGNKLTETAPDGFITAYTYDGFGRLKTSSDNNGLNTTINYIWGYSLPGDFVSYLGAVYYVSATSNNGATTYTLYDRLGREMKNKTRNFEDQWISVWKTYNTIGQLSSVTKPYFDNTTPQYVSYTYDAYGRPTTLSAPEGNTTYTYSPAGGTTYTISVTNPAGQSTTTTTDASGVKASSTDAQNNMLTYVYYSNGNLKRVDGAGATLQKYTYDNFNHLTERWDPNYGVYKYTYDAYGQILSQTDPKTQTYTYKYDGLGRRYQKTGPEGDYFYQYNDNVGPNCGKMTLLTGPEGKISYDYGIGDKINSVTYMDNGLSSSATGNSNYGNYTYIYNYNSYGMLVSKYCPLGVGFTYGYGVNGNLTTINDANTNTVFYHTQDEDANGQTTAYFQQSGTTGNIFATQNTFDSYNLLTEQKTLSGSNALRDMTYGFDPATGNLLSRKDNKYGLQETFGYDNLNRLKDISNSNNTLLDISMQYSINGNIEEKTDAGGSFEYDQANRVSTINLNSAQPENIPHITQEVAYTPFDMVKTIDEGDYHTEFHYWPDGNRSMMVTTNNVTGTQEYKMYAPNVEIKFLPSSGEEHSLVYVNGPDGDIVAMQSLENWGVANHFVLTDYLGSFTQIIDDWGNIEEEKSFDAWGRLRDPQTWEPYASNIAAGQPFQMFDRGYTGHEYLPYYGIINMNGRLYDPVMGRMFSPDPYIMGKGGDLQGYNRYTYVLNNPLKYNDPSGKFVNLIIGAAIGGFWNWMSHGAEISWKGLGYFGVGAAAGLVGAGVGGGISSTLAGTGFGAGFIGSTTASAATSSFLTGSLIGGGAGLASGLVSGSGNAALSGNNILGGALKEGTIGLITGGLSGGISGGIDAVKNYRNFWDGIPTLYDASTPVLASANTADALYSNCENCTLINNNSDGSPVFYKPEHGPYSAKYYVPAGKGIKAPIDGVATSASSNFVYKVPTGGRIIVGVDGAVYPSNWRAKAADATWPFGLWGWKDAQFFISKGAYYSTPAWQEGWDKLFNVAKIIRYLIPR